MQPTLIKASIGVFGSIASLLWGGWSEALTVLLVLVCIDYVTGMMAGYITKTLSSRVGFIGIMRKAAIFLMLSLAHHLDVILQTGGLLMQGSIFFYLTNEALSILENMGRMGIPIPNNVANSLQILETKKDSKDKEQG